MTNEVLHFTHNDLDAMGCMLNLHFALPKARITTVHTNYRNFAEQIGKAEEIVKQNHIPLIIITDVCFSQHKDYLRTLIATGAQVLYIDHHIVPNGFFDDLNIKYVHDTSKSATLLTHEYFGNQGKNANLDAITRLIDVYDLWQIEAPFFQTAIDLNDFYWQNSDTLYDYMSRHNYNLPERFGSDVANYKAKAESTISKYYERGLIHTAKDVTICFCDEYFTDVLLKELRLKRKIVIVANSYGIIRVRFNQLNDVNAEVKHAIKGDICGTVDTGHLNAFTLSIPQPNFEKLMDEIKRISAIIDKHL